MRQFGCGVRNRKSRTKHFIWCLHPLQLFHRSVSGRTNWTQMGTFLWMDALHLLLGVSEVVHDYTSVFQARFLGRTFVDQQWDTPDDYCNGVCKDHRPNAREVPEQGQQCVLGNFFHTKGA